MRIEYAIPAKFAEVNDNLATIVGAGIDTFAVPALPAGLGLMLAVRVVGEAAELPGDHRLRCRIRDVADQVVGPELDGTIHIEPRPGAQTRDDWLQNMMLAVGVQFEAAAEGTYTITIMFDESEYAVPVHVVVAQQ